MPHIGVKDAVHIAKDFIQETFGDEAIMNVGLEEVKYDDDENSWKITVGFSRPWDDEGSLLVPLQRKYRRVYKVVTIDDSTGEPRAITLREIAA
jgi:hypothetical protein